MMRQWWMLYLFFLLLCLTLGYPMHKRDDDDQKLHPTHLHQVHYGIRSGEHSCYEKDTEYTCKITSIAFL